MSFLKQIFSLEVYLNFGSEEIKVGKLAVKNSEIYFEYSEEILNQNIQISPIKLPLQKGLMSFNPMLFDGLPGVFNDSLPDGWGRLLLDRLLLGKGVSTDQVTALDRLSYVGENGFGALTYKPFYNEIMPNSFIKLDKIAKEINEVIEGKAEDIIEELLTANGSSAGARPKVIIGLGQDKKKIIHGKNFLPTEYEHWLIKFKNRQDTKDAGAIEYSYYQMARDAEIDIMPSFLFPSKDCSGYFGTKRFDRSGLERLHMHTACGLLHSNFRTPILDYSDLISLTEKLTKDIREVKKVFKLAVFNVLSHNKDDHSKNFSFLMNKKGGWSFSPAYDLTFSSGPNNLQSTMVLGKGQNLNKADLINLGTFANLSLEETKSIIERTKDSLNKWPEIATNNGVLKENIKLIQKCLERTSSRNY